MRLVIERVDDDGERRTERHEVPEEPGMTVLDAMFWVREHVDPSLAVRFSCRSANACKECLAVVDGERTYTCTTPAVGEVSVAAIPNKTVLRDLVTRM
jgi:succinate dehydrogenase/fumarate reductase-like Fe-S protein